MVVNNQWFDLIINSYINGQFKQLALQMFSLQVRNYPAFIDYSKEVIGAEKTLELFKKYYSMRCG
jgi:hypothetical protein